MEHQIEKSEEIVQSSLDTIHRITREERSNLCFHLRLIEMKLESALGTYKNNPTEQGRLQLYETLASISNIRNEMTSKRNQDFRAKRALFERKMEKEEAMNDMIDKIQHTMIHTVYTNLQRYGSRSHASYVYRDRDAR
jgi:hypothetical protein